MARKVEVVLIDDTDGGRADETVRFGLDGVQYEIDLSGKNAQALRAALDRYTSSGRKLGRMPVMKSSSGLRASTPSVPAKSDREQNVAMRAFARRKGIQLSNRGRIPRYIVEDYQASGGVVHPKVSEAAPPPAPAEAAPAKLGGILQRAAAVAAARNGKPTKSVGAAARNGKPTKSAVTAAGRGRSAVRAGT